MTDTPFTPQNIVLATDLGPRSDRALERSYSLARRWKARLTIAHAIEFQPYHKDVPSWRQGPGKIDILKSRLGQEVEYEQLSPRPSIVIEEGKPETLVLSVAQEVAADLIITGIAHNEPLGRNILGYTVNTLARKAPCPVLAVKKRLRGEYRKIVVGIDRSENAKKALLYALSCFPDAESIALVHAVSVPFRSRTANPDQYAKSMCDEERQRCEAFIGEFLTPEQRKMVSLVVDEGAAGWLLADYVSDMDVDLVVIGTHEEGGIIDSLMGNAANGILEHVPCDVLVVR